jgi:hypothetical protein
LLKAMLEELDRSKSELQLKDFAKPFFIQYRIEDVDNFETKRSLGPARARSTTTSAWPASRCGWANTRPTVPAAAETARSN